MHLLLRQRQPARAAKAQSTCWRLLEFCSLTHHNHHHMFLALHALSSGCYSALTAKDTADTAHCDIHINGTHTHAALRRGPLALKVSRCEPQDAARARASLANNHACTAAHGTQLPSCPNSHEGCNNESAIHLRTHTHKQRHCESQSQSQSVTLTLTCGWSGESRGHVAWLQPLVPSTPRPRPRLPRTYHRCRTVP